MNLVEALTVCLGRHRNPVETARDLRCLKDLPEYGNNWRTAEAVGMTPATVRSLLALLELPPEIRRMLERGESLQTCVNRRCGITRIMQGKDAVEYIPREG